MTDKTATCPVCDETIDVERHTPKKLKGGVIHHFCSEDHRDEFVRNPSEYTNSRRRTQTGLP